MKIKKTSKKYLLHSAFTLVELVFVIVIIGIMAGVGSSAFKPKYLLEDTNFIAMKIKEAQFLGIGRDHLDFGGASSGADYKSGCILFKKENLNENAGVSNEINYKLHVIIGGSLKNNTLCFDSKGRPHLDDFNGAFLTRQNNILTLTYSSNEKNITIEPVTGYLLITQ